MGGICSLHVGDEECVQNFSLKTLKEDTTCDTLAYKEDNINMGLI
jgi:hypothetical protein